MTCNAIILRVVTVVALVVLVREPVNSNLALYILNWFINSMFVCLFGYVFLSSFYYCSMPLEEDK